LLCLRELRLCVHGAAWVAGDTAGILTYFVR
jgi:hypothetical protein